MRKVRAATVCLNLQRVDEVMHFSSVALWWCLLIYTRFMFYSGWKSTTADKTLPAPENQSYGSLRYSREIRGHHIPPNIWSSEEVLQGHSYQRRWLVKISNLWQLIGLVYCICGRNKIDFEIGIRGWLSGYEFLVISVYCKMIVNFLNTFFTWRCVTFVCRCIWNRKHHIENTTTESASTTQKMCESPIFIWRGGAWAVPAWWTSGWGLS